MPDLNRPPKTAPGRARSRGLAAVVCACLTAASPLRGAQPPAIPDTEAWARKQVEAAMQEYTRLLNAGPPEALAASFAADGELPEPGMAALRGPAAIPAFPAPIFAVFNLEAASTETEAIEVHGSAAYLWGTYSQGVAEHGKPAAECLGRLVVGWPREADGHWRITHLLVQPFPN